MNNVDAILQTQIYAKILILCRLYSDVKRLHAQAEPEGWTPLMTDGTTVLFLPNQVTLDGVALVPAERYSKAEKFWYEMFSKRTVSYLANQQQTVSQRHSLKCGLIDDNFMCRVIIPYIVVYIK